MTAMFHNMVEDFMEVFMDDFSVFGNSFDCYLANLDRMLARCEETNLVLNWEKCHFMVKEGIVLGHKTSRAGIKVDRAKINVIAKLPYPTNVKGVRTKKTRNQDSLGGFYFSKDLTLRLRIKKGAENLASDHLSRLENPNLGTFAEEEITDEFLDEHLMILKAELNNDEPWYADYINYIFGKIIPLIWTPKKRRIFFSQVKYYFWDEPYAFKLCSENVMRRCVAGNEIFEILAHYHSGPTGGHHSATIIGRKVYESGLYWPSIFKDAKDYVMKCDAYQRSGNISSRSEMPQNNIQSEKLDDALWAFKTAYKMPTGCTPFRLVYEKACHLPVKIQHKAYWALKQCNMDLIAAVKNNFMELNELMELRDKAYENTRIYKKRTEKWHDSRLRGDKNFKEGDKDLVKEISTNIGGEFMNLEILKPIRRIHQGRYGVSVPTLTKDHKRNEAQYAVSRGLNTPYSRYVINIIFWKISNVVPTPRNPQYAVSNTWIRRIQPTGALQYLTFTRPDISYAVQQVCLFMHDPREPHLSALKRILRYVRGTLSYGLQLYSSTTSSLVAYSDADWAGCPTTRRSTSGYCVFLGNNLLSWSSKRQFTLSRSSAEAEYRGVANAVAETCWLRNLLRELHTPLATATLVYCDNVSAVYLSSNPVQHQRTKHIEIDIHFVRDLVATGAIRVLHVPSRYQYADIFTKGLPTSLFDEFRTSLSVRSSPAPTAGGC
ncbi:ribonuclease H-like domain-containing protein [Tanacetum coccineum]